jgi:uncharacterized membrane protein YedE/YeeE
MTAYWPWWLGALALGGITLGFCMLLHRPLGVSGSWARLVGWRESHVHDKIEAPFRNNPSMLEDALLAATISEFGDKITFQTMYAAGGPGTAVTLPASGAEKSDSTQSPAVSEHSPWTAHLTFLVALFLGSVLSVVDAGGFQLHYDLGEVHKHFFGSGWFMWIALIMGGAMVGFGTQMGGGCTSGHGLSGCSRLVPASLISTCLFFGSAVAVSFLVEVLAK